MVKLLVNLDEHANEVLKIVKENYKLKNKSQALNFITAQLEEKKSFVTSEIDFN